MSLPVFEAAPGLPLHFVRRASSAELPALDATRKDAILQPRDPHAFRLRCTDEIAVEVGDSLFTIVDFHYGTAWRIASTAQLAYRNRVDSLAAADALIASLEDAGFTREDRLDADACDELADAHESIRHLPSHRGLRDRLLAGGGVASHGGAQGLWAGEVSPDGRRRLPRHADRLRPDAVMKLTRIATERVRTLPDGEHRLAHSDGRPHDIAVISGPPASGKTTLLTAITMAIGRVAPRGRPSRPRDFLRHDDSNGRVELTIVLSAEERKASGYKDPIGTIGVMLSGSPVDNDERVVGVLRRGVVDYVPCRRQLTEPIGMEPPPDERAEQRMRLSDDPDKYRGVLSWLRQRLMHRASAVTAKLQEGGMVMAGDASASDPLADFRATLATMCPWLRLAGLAGDGRTPMFVRDDGSRTPAMELSATEQDALLIATTAHRFWKPGALVLIDRPDLHAGAELARTWLAVLGAAFGCQLVVTGPSDGLAPEGAQLRLGR